MNVTLASISLGVGVVLISYVSTHLGKKYTNIGRLRQCVSGERGEKVIEKDNICLVCCNEQWNWTM